MDWNDDGWPDLIVANDIGGGRLRVYENMEGRSFKRVTTYDEHLWEGGWMGIQSGDLDGDRYDEVLVANLGSQVMSIRNTALLVDNGKENHVQALVVINYPLEKSNIHHALLSFKPGRGLENVTSQTTIHHSSIIPPDMVYEKNFSPHYKELHKKSNFKNSLNGLEFSWGPAVFDVENDGDLDIYLAGSISRGNDNFLGDWSGSPGRMLINESQPGSFLFADKTLEYRLLDVTDMEYTTHPPTTCSRHGLA